MERYRRISEEVIPQNADAQETLNRAIEMAEATGRSVYVEQKPNGDTVFTTIPEQLIASAPDGLLPSDVIFDPLPSVTTPSKVTPPKISPSSDNYVERKGGGKKNKERNLQKPGKHHDLTGFTGFYRGTYYQNGEVPQKPNGAKENGKKKSKKNR